jgi:hypothetical protein|nr:hypothetical protein [uncultured Lachnoclostridium sp.]
MKQDVARCEVLILLLELKGEKLKLILHRKQEQPEYHFESTCFRMLFGLFFLEMMLHQDKSTFITSDMNITEVRLL